MADIPVKISELDKSYSLSASPVSFLINQRNDNGVFETKSLPLSVLVEFAKEEAKKELIGFIEVGTIIPYAGEVLGQESIKGWLLCNGQQVRKADYESLWNLLGDTYGPSTKDLFSLPDLKGRIEMGYSHTEESYEPDFGNWISGNKIYLGEGNNANYPDRGVYSYQLKNEHIQNHIHYVSPHTHKIFNYANMADFTRRSGGGFGAVRGGGEYIINVKGRWVNTPSENWINIYAIGPLNYNIDRALFYFDYQAVIISNSYDTIVYNRLNYKSYNSDWVKAVNNYISKNPVRTILTYKKEFIEEIKNRKKKPPIINQAFNNNMKTSFSKDKTGGDAFHDNIQPFISTNFLIKY
jgi:microcystin-dependent protein